MSLSLIQNINVHAVKIHDIIIPNQDVAGTGGGNVLDRSDTEFSCSPNSIVKYVNVRMQSALRVVAPELAGWLEYAIVVFQERQIIPPVDAIISAGTNTQTLGDLCVNLYRGKCIWNGCIPISPELPRCTDVKIKIPDTYCKQRNGQYLQLLMTFRSSDATDVTSSIRLISSHQYKVYL